MSSAVFGRRWFSLDFHDREICHSAFSDRLSESSTSAIFHSLCFCFLSLCIFLSFFLYLCLYSLSHHPSPRAFSARTSFGYVGVQASLSSKVALEADAISMLMEMQQRTYKRATVIHAQRKWTSTLGYAHSAAYYRLSRELKANHGERFGNHS